MTQIRIGDAERDAAASALGEHYAAGRLTKDEYDERIDRVWAAKYEDELVPVFSDLPRRRVSATSARGTVTPAGSGLPRRGFVPAGFHPLTLLAPIAVAAVIAAVIISGGPWVLLLFFFWFFGGMGRRWHRHWTHSR